MKRREMLKQVAIATTAAMLLPSCIADPKKVSIALNNLSITGDDEDLLANIADTIIPATDKPGAKAIGAHLFALVMVDDCVDKTTKDKYLKGMRTFDETCKKISGKTFSKSNPEERLATLTNLEKQLDGLSDEVKTFYGTSKGYIMEGYLSSEYFLTEVKPYKLVPGPDFKGCVPVSQTPNS